MKTLGLLLLLLSVLQACDLSHNGIYSDLTYEEFFRMDKVHRLKLTISLSEWQAITNDMWKSSRDWGPLGRGTDYGTNINFFFNSAIYRQAQFQDLDTGVVFENIGLKVRGSTSRFVPQYWDGSFKWVHWKFSFSHQFEGNEDVYGSPSLPGIIKKHRKLYGVKGFTLKYTRGDSTWVKEEYSYALLRQYGIPAPLTTYANLQIEITGYTNINYGLYEVVELIDDDFTKRRWGQKGLLYKCLITADGPADLKVNKLFDWDNDFNKNVSVGIEKMDPVDIIQAAAWDVNDWPIDPTALRVYRPRYDVVNSMGDLTRARQVIDDLVWGLYTVSDADFPVWIDSVFDVRGLLRVLAVDTLLGQWDSYFMNFNNYYLYLHADTGKLIYIPYDYDGCMLDQGIMDVASQNIPITNRSVTNFTSTNAILMNRILAVPAFRQYFYDCVKELATHPGLYNWPAMREKMNKLQDIVRPYATAPDIIHDDPAGWLDVDYSSFQRFVESRLSIVSNELLH